MSQIYKQSSGGGGSVTLVPDSGGGISGSSINVFGFPAGTSQVIETYNDGGDLKISDQTFLSRYVVDSSTTPGLKGTYTTINDAITQAIADGFSILTDLATIYVRPGTYIEDISFPALCALQIVGLSECGLNQNTSDVVIQGSITHEAQSYAILRNIANNPPGTDGVIVEDGAFGVFYTACSLIGGSNSALLFNGNTAPFIGQECFITAPIVTASTSTAVNLNNCAAFYDTNLNSVSRFEGAGKARFYNCDVAGFVLDDTSAIAFYNCNTRGNITGTSTGTSRAYNTVYLATGTGSPFFNFSGTIEYAGCTVTNGSSIYSLTPTRIHQPTDQGDVMNGTYITGDYSVLFSDFYVGVTSAPAPSTITLPDPALIPIGKLFVIKDQSGTIAANPITLVAASGNIDNLASALMNNNLQSTTLRSDGTDYWSIF